MRTYKDIEVKYYDTKGDVHVRCSVPVTEDALVHFELMQSHYCKLSFKLGSAIYFKMGDFIVTDYGRFELVDNVKPKDDGNLGYSYELEFDAYYRKWKNKRLKYMPNSGSPEGTFTLTSNIITHANIIKDNLDFLAKASKSYLYDPNYTGKGSDYTFVVDASVDSTKSKVITYSNSSILDAIANIAQTFECEWWVEGNLVHFGTCENTNEVVDFKDGENIVSMSSSQSQASYANRVYAFGAARNLPSGYKQNSSADVTKNGVVEKRLMLPTLEECSAENKKLLEDNGFELKNGCLQVKGLTEDEYVEGVTTNDDIYPRNLIKTSNVTYYEKDVEDESTPEEGDYIKRTFYRVKGLTIVDADGNKTGDMAFRSSYILSGKTLHIIFQSGSLNGMDFECQFNPDGESEILRDSNGSPILKDGKEQINPAAQVFEIVANEDYGRFLPDTVLHPKDGDTFVLYNWDSTKLGNTLVTSSANELLTDAIKNLKKSMIDPTTYTCTAASDYSYNDGKGQFHFEGDRVNLFNKGYDMSFRASRIIGYELHLDVPFDSVKYTVGEKPAYSRLNAMSSQIEELVFNGQSYLNKGGSGNSIYIIKSYDTTVQPTDFNVFSAKRVENSYLHKDKTDAANFLIKFLRGLQVGDYSALSGGDWSLDELFRSHLTTDYLNVRMKAIFETLEILHTDTLGGELFITPVGSNRILKVEEVNITYDGVSQKAYRCYFLGEQDGSKVENKWKVGDQARSKSFNLTAGKYHNVGNHYYWRLVIGVSSEAVEIDGKKYHYVDLSDIDKDAASDEPMVDDILNQCGNRTDITRQSCLVFSAVDTYSPCIALYHGVDGYTFNNKEYVDYGVNHSTNKAFFHVYGDMYVGDRPTKENGYEGSSYIRYDSSTKQLSVKGKISAKSTVDGKELSQYFNKIAELQNQVDGAIETWFYDGVPTLENAPAISWKTDKDKEIHLGDLYYDNKTGKAYRFAKDSNTYKWTIITDTDIAKALSDARMAQETANGKMKVFSVQPTTPYQVGDIWVNATYPSDGSTYKNEVLRCQTNKAAGSQFAIGDWIKASKYTDDTVANAAKKAAEDAQKAAQTAQTDIKNLGKTVTDNKKEFDNYVTDGYLEPSEIAAMAQDSKRLEDDFAAAQKSYNEVKNAEVLKDTKELTDLNTAFATLTTAKTELVTYLSDISKRYNETDTNGKAAIVSAVGTKFTNFQSAYSAFYDKLGLANAYITSKIYGDLKQNITDLAGYKYLKDALGQTTDIDGGLVMTTLLALRDGDGNVQSGINGAIDPNRGKKSIATWWGGQMVDKDYNSGNLTPATSLIRFDGSGYLANGAIWWDVSGKVHADPTSFIISEKNLGVYLIFFEPTWKEGSAGTSVADLVSLKPNAPFSKLGVSGDATFEGAISFHGIKLTYDSTNKAIKIDGNLYATGGITAYGAGSSTTGGGGGLNGSVKSYSNALKLTSESLSEIASAYSIKALDSRISSLEGGSAMDVSVSGSGNAVTAISKSGTTIIVTKGTTFLTSHQSLASYLTRTDAASLYQPKGNYLTAHQSLDGYVNEVATSGTGNAITSVSKSGKKLTFTKGATFLTSHQSLANYVTINDSRLSDSRYPKFANGTWYLVGDDAYIGDHNLGGRFCIKSANNDYVSGIAIYNKAESSVANLWFDNTNINLDKQLVMNNKRIWIQGVGTAGGNNNRLTLVAGMPSGLAYNTSCRGTILYSNGIAFADPYNGNSNNDSGWIRHLETSANSGTLEIAVGDDASNEQIHFRWYNTNSSAETIAHDITVPRATGTLALTSQIPTTLPANGGNADTVDGIHANGLLTALSNSNNGISITVGGTTKSVSNISVNYASSAGSSGSASKVYGQVKDTGSHELVRCAMNSDQFRIIAGSNGNNNGWAEIATAGDGNEPIYVRQYSGAFNSVVRTLTLLDDKGYTHFPSYINIGGNENNNSSPDRVWGSNGSDSYLRSYRTSALNVNYAASAGNADKLDGYHESSFLRYRGAYEDASVTKDGVGVYGWAHTNTGHNNFHESYGDIINIQGFSTWRTRFDIGISGRIRIVHGINTTTATQVGYLAYLHDNVASATKLQTPRTIWGQNFDGTGNVSGSLSEVGNIHFKVDDSYDIGSDAAASRHIYTHWLGARSGRKLELGANNSGFGQGLCIDTNLNVGIGAASPAYKLHVAGDIYSSSTIRTAAQNKAIVLSNDENPAWISALSGQVIFNTGNAIRFGATNWEYSDWAGLKYDTVANAIYLGIADGTVFNCCDHKRSNGTLKFPGITTITPDAAARIGGSGGNLYLGNANNSGWVYVQNMCSQVNSSYWNITQYGSATFKSLTVTDVISCNSISVSNNAIIAGNLSVDGLISNKGILPANYEFNNKGTSCYVSADALCSGITAITDSIQVNQVTVQYSNDSGNSWTNYSMNNDAKFNLYASNAGLTQVYLGCNVITGNNDAEKLAQVKKNELMVTFEISNNCYSQVYFASVDISNGIDTICTVECLNNSGAVVRTYTKHVTGWNQVNYINISEGNAGYGLGRDSNRYIRFRFKHDQKTTALRNTIINKIRIFSFTKYSFPTDRFMGHTGHIYNFDYNMNTYFPNSILAKGGVTAYQSSDVRLKTNINKLNCLNVIKSIGGTYEFDYIRDHKHSIGFIAQNVNNPLLKDIVAKDDNGYLKINYWNPKLISLAFGALTEIDDEVDKLKARVRELESEVKYLKNKAYALQ